MFKKIFYIFIIFAICKLHAMDDNESRTNKEYYNRFETAVKIIDSQIKMIEAESACPSLDSIRYVDETLKPITAFLASFGQRTDPVVNVSMTALDQFKLCLNAYYSLGHSSTSFYVQSLRPDLQIEFNKSFRGIMKNYASNTGLCFKMYLQMVLYETSENYAEFFPVNVIKNHEMFMKQATETLHNFYLTQFLSSLRLEQDSDQHAFFCAVYKAFKPFSFAWQKIIQDSWQAHYNAFQRISPSGFKENLSGIMACSKLLNSLVMSSEWKKTLSREKFLLMVLDQYKEHPMTVIQGTDQSCFIIHPLPKLPHNNFSKVTEEVLSLPAVVSTVVPETSTPPETLPEEKAGQNGTNSGASSTVDNEKQPSLGTEIIPFDKPTSNISSTGMTIEQLNTHESIESEGKINLQKEEMLSQAQDIFEFYHTLEPADSQLSINDRQTTKPVHHKGKRISKAVKQNPKLVNSLPTKKEQSIKVEKDRIVLTLGRKKTRDAIVDFLKAFNQISASVKKSLHPNVSKAIRELVTNPDLKLSKAYKLMLGIVPHVGKFEMDRGKGSHALITLYVTGPQKADVTRSQKEMTNLPK